MAQLGARHRYVAQFRPTKLGSLKIRVRKVRPIQIGLSEISVAKITATHADSNQTGLAEVRAEKRKLAQIEVTQVRAGKVWLFLAVLVPPSVPRCGSWATRADAATPQTVTSDTPAADDAPGRRRRPVP